MHLSRVHVAGHLHLVNALEVQKMRILHSFLRHMHLSRVHVACHLHLVNALAIIKIRIWRSS